MSLRLTRDLFNSAERVEGSGQIKNTLQITVTTTGAVTDSQGEVLDILSYGNRGDHCVTKLEFTLPEALQEGYECFIVADLKEGLYLQHCSMDENNKAIAWITSNMTFSETSMLNTLFVCVESEALQSGNIDGEVEIFVTDEFSGEVKKNFLVEGWHTGTVDDGHVIDNDVLVNDNAVPPLPNPTQYTPMTWYNGVTELNAANMNNIMYGIDHSVYCGTRQNIRDVYTFEELYNLSQGRPIIDEGGYMYCVKPHTNNNYLISYIEPSYGWLPEDTVLANEKFVDYIDDADMCHFLSKEQAAILYAGKTDLGNNLFTPESNINVEMQHSYKIGDLVFVHIKLNRTSTVSSTGIYTIGTLGKHALHEHMFMGACYNGSAANSDVGILTTNGELKLRFTSTTSGSTYKWDLSFFFAEEN